MSEPPLLPQAWRIARRELRAGPRGFGVFLACLFLGVFAVAAVVLLGSLAGYGLCLGMPLLAPAGVWLRVPWLAPLVVFGLFPFVSLVIGEDHSLPIAGLRRWPGLVAYLDSLPRIYGRHWMGTLAWAARYASRTTLSGTHLAALTVSVGSGSAAAICTAHELMHRRSKADVLLARLMTALCLYGHMLVEHFQHHATVGDVAAGSTAPRGMSISTL